MTDYGPENLGNVGCSTGKNNGTIIRMALIKQAAV